MNVIDHIGLQVSDYGRALDFYGQALAPLGIALVMQVKAEESGGYQGAGFGRNGKPSFWLEAGTTTAPHVHVAFVAENRAAVDGFHTAALAAGGRDNGPPGLRPHYPPTITAPSCSTRTAIISRRSATGRNRSRGSERAAAAPGKG